MEQLLFGPRNLPWPAVSQKAVMEKAVMELFSTGSFVCTGNWGCSSTPQTPLNIQTRNNLKIVNFLGSSICNFNCQVKDQQRIAVPLTTHASSPETIHQVNWYLCRKIQRPFAFERQRLELTGITEACGGSKTYAGWELFAYFITEYLHRFIKLDCKQSKLMHYPCHLLQNTRGIYTKWRLLESKTIHPYLSNTRDF